MTSSHSNGAPRRSVWTGQWNMAKKRGHCVWPFGIARKFWNFGWNMNWEIPRATQENDTDYFESFRIYIICNTPVCNSANGEFMALRKLCRCRSFGRRKVSNKLSGRIGVEMLLSLHHFHEKFVVSLIPPFQKCQLKPWIQKSIIWLSTVQKSFSLPPHMNNVVKNVI